MSDYEIPEDCRYTEDDEWIRVDAGGARVGITDYAQQQLGDIVFVELAEPGDTRPRATPSAPSSRSRPSPISTLRSRER